MKKIRVELSNGKVIDEVIWRRYLSVVSHEYVRGVLNKKYGQKGWNGYISIKN